MRRSRGRAGKVAMASNSRLLKRRQRSSCSSSPENHWEGDGDVKLQETLVARDDKYTKDLDFLARNKRRSGDLSLQGCDATEVGHESTGTGRCVDEEFEVEHEEVTPESMTKSPTEMLNPNQRNLRSRQCLVSEMSTGVIGTQIPRKARSACVKRWPHEYPASGGNHHQHSNSAASESGEKTAGSKNQICKSTNLTGSVDEDIEMEVAEVLFDLMRQCQHPAIARDSQQKRHVSNVKESKQFKGDGGVCSGKNNTEQAENFGGSELKLVPKYEVPIRLENAGTLIEEDRLMGEIKKKKSFSHRGSKLQSRNSGVTEAIQMTPLADYQAGKLEVSPNQEAESFGKLVQGSKWNPRDVDTKTMNRTTKHMPEVTLGKQELYMTDMRSSNVPIHDTSLQVEQSYWSLEATKTAQITPSSFHVSKDLGPTDSSMGHMQPKGTIAFMDKSSGPSMLCQSRKMSQDGRKRCATHYYIAQSIVYHQQCDKMNFPSSAAGSSCSIASGLSSVKKDVLKRQPQGVFLKGNNIVSTLQTVADSTFPRDKETATEASCLPDVAQRKQHLNHKAPRLSSSESKMIAPALALPAKQYQMAGLNLERSGTPISASSLKTTSLCKNATSTGALTACSTFSTTDPAMNFYNSRQVISEAPPFMTIIPSYGYPFPISVPVGNSASFKGGVHGHGMPYYNGSSCSPQMFYPPQLLSQQPCPQTPILPSGRSPTRLSHLSATHNQPHHQQQHGPSVDGHSLLPSSTVHSQFPQKQRIQSSHQSCNPEAEIADKQPLVVDNRLSYGERIAYNQHGQLPQMNFTMIPMVAGNGNAKKFEKQESSQGRKVGVELPTSQAFSMSYSPLGGSNVVSGINLSLPTRNLPLFPSLPEVAHQTYLVPQTADVVNQRKYEAREKSGIDFTGADSARKGATGKSSSWASQSPAFSKAVTYDQASMVKGSSIFDSSAKTLSFNTSSQTANYQNHNGIQLQQHLAQGIWNKTPVTNGQPSPAMSTNVSYSPVLMSHSAHWNSSARSALPQSTSTQPTLAKNPLHQVISSPCPPQFTLGGNNVIKSVAAQGNGMSVMQSPSTLDGSCPTGKSSHLSSRRNKSGSVASSPTAVQLNETCSSSPSQRISPSPVCRRNVPSILSPCPSQVSEIKN